MVKTQHARWWSIAAVSLVALIPVIGCSGGFGGAQRAAWRGEAEQACLRSGTLQGLPFVREARAIDGPGTCGADYPMKVAGIAADITGSVGDARGFSTAIKPEATLACPMIPALNAWMAEVVQPAAMRYFGQPVSELRIMGSYACRSRNNQRGAKLSEHSFANALDVGGFKLADGSIISVKSGWKGDVASQGFLKSAHQGACRHFKTILGPGSDMFHYDHFHFDLARHGRKGAVVCRPRVTIPEMPEGFEAGSPISYQGADANMPIKPLPDQQSGTAEQEPQLDAASGDNFDSSSFDMPAQ